MENLNRDIVYIYKKLDNSEELKYSIRSVAENFPHRNLWIIGDKPSWANEKVNIVPDSDIRYTIHTGGRYGNVNNKLLVACSMREISDEFWFFNDDFFILTPQEDFQTFYDGSIQEKYKRLKDAFPNLKSWPYLRGFESAEKILRVNRCKTFLNYETHVPILFEKEKLKKVIKNYPSEPCRRSIYMNIYYPSEGILHEDVKKYEKTDKITLQDELVSTENNTFKDNIGNYIKEQFKEKCKYER